MHLPLYLTPLKTVNSLYWLIIILLPQKILYCHIGQLITFYHVIRLLKINIQKVAFFLRIFKSTSIHMPVVKIGIRLTKQNQCSLVLSL